MSQELFEKKITSLPLGQEVPFIDIGAESTRPGASPVSPEEEWRRLEPYLHYCLKKSIPFSLDSYHLETIQRAHSFGMVAVNDVSANQKIFEWARKENLLYIAMHKRGAPSTMRALENDFLTKQEVISHFAPFLEYEKTLLDPGLGFGKSRALDLKILQWMVDSLPVEKIFVGASRKRLLDFLQDGSEDSLSREFAHVALINALWRQGVLWYRVHEVNGILNFLRANEKLKHVFKFS